jgi:hypothetical protein
MRAYLGGWTSIMQEERHIVITRKFVTQLFDGDRDELAHFCGGNKSTGKDTGPRPTRSRRNEKRGRQIQLPRHAALPRTH